MKMHPTEAMVRMARFQKLCDEQQVVKTNLGELSARLRAAEERLVEVEADVLSHTPEQARTRYLAISEFVAAQRNASDLFILLGQLMRRSADVIEPVMDSVRDDLKKHVDL